MKSPRVKAQEFLKNANYFHLGQLPSEASHPDTEDLSRLANENLPKAISLLQKIDVHALRKLNEYFSDLSTLTQAVKQTLASGGRIFLCGCGATGRLSLTLEYLWRTSKAKNKDSVIGFMAGGDVALVHSLEGFEDFSEYGAEQLMGLGFSHNDLLISSTEGGETTFVIGATEKAAQISKRAPFFLYCNPREVLVENVERSRRVLKNKKIQNICLEVGPMALSGSTRMQASTVLMLGIGMSLFDLPRNALVDFVKFYEAVSLLPLEHFIKAEADAYKSNNRVLYTAEDLAITVFTDTTERAPTFSLPSFSNQTQDLQDLSLAYLMIPSAANVTESWYKLLARSPRVLDWPSRNVKTTLEYLEGFDFSKSALKNRKQAAPTSEHFIFAIEHIGHAIRWQFRENEVAFKIPEAGNLFDHIFLKLMLNIHSTLIMGRMNRYVSNFMTYVSPTNGKLIDRAARYAQWLLERNGVNSVSYAQIIEELFIQLETLEAGESVVMKIFAALKDKSN